MSLKQNADALLESAVAASTVPGVIAIVTNREGNIYEGAFGNRVLGGADPMALDTVAWIASMTKAVTAAAAMQLVEQGRLDLDAPAGRMLPELAAVQVLDGFGAAGAPRLRAPKREVTLRHLLTHTSGFAYDMWNADLAAYRKAASVPGVTTCTNKALALPLVFDPGERWEYGIGIDWAGKMVEAVSGKRLGVYFSENIFAPLGMTSTGFRISPDMRARLAKIHARTPGGLVPLDLEIPQEPEFDMGGGGLYSTAPDYARFVRMILNRGEGGGNRVLAAETVDLMARNNMGATRTRPMTSVAPQQTNDVDLFPGIEKSWGLSFMINETAAPTGRSAGSLAWAGLANSYYWIDPTRGLGGVYITQILPFADVLSLPLFEQFETAVYANA